jgi:hypothetical protein
MFLTKKTKKILINNKKTNVIIYKINLTNNRLQIKKSKKNKTKEMENISFK